MNKFRLSLKKGWNLVSFFLENIDFENFTKNKNILEIKNLNNSYNKKLPSNTLNNFVIGEGYIIKVENDEIVELDGDVYKEDIKYILKSGWNFIGYPFKISTPIQKLESVIEVKNLNSSYNKNIFFELNSLINFEPFNSYWVYVDEDTELKITNTFEYNQVINNNINGYILEQSLCKNDLFNFDNESYIIEKTKNYTFELSKYSLRDLNYSKLRKIFYKLDKINFILFYGKWNGELKSVGIKLCNNFEVLDNFFGKIYVNPREYNNENKYLEMYFNNNQNIRIFFNITKKLISIVYNENYILVTNLNYVLNTDNNSKIFNDFKFENLLISKLIIQKNNNLLDILKYNLNYQKEDTLVLEIITSKENITLIIKIINDDKKMINLTMFKDNKYYEYRLQIFKNKKFNIKFYEDNYIFNIDWIGQETEIKKYIVEKFIFNTQYLYWFNFTTLNFSDIKINNVSLIPILNFLEKNPDYMIFELNSDINVYKMFLMKSKFNKGYINLIMDIKSKNENKYNIRNRKFLEWNIYNNSSFKIDDIEIILKWTGYYNENGYSLKNVDINKQRLLYDKINTYKIFNFSNFSLKLHYSIGEYNSIDLTIWESYNNFLEYFEKIIEKIVNIINLYQLKFPFNDNLLSRNGGDSIYDVYISEIENKFIKGSTIAELYNYYTKNKNDVISHILISNTLDKKWLEVVLIHEFFHAIHGNYDWFDKLWISEGLAVTFEYSITNSNLSEYFFIPFLLENRFLSLSYCGNFTMNNNIVKTTKLRNNEFSDEGRIVLYIEKIYTKNGELKISDEIINKINLFNKNDESIKIDEIEIIKYREINILKIILDSNRKIDFMTFNIVYENLIVNHLVPSFKTRPYSTFLFFKYLEENYGGKNIFKNILNESIVHNNFELIDKTLKKINPDSNINDEILNFWIACEIMSDNKNIEKKYRFENAKVWKNKYINNNIKLDINFNEKTYKINNLEPSGCYVFNLNLKNKAYFKISNLEGLHVFIVNKNDDNSYNVNKILLTDIFYEEKQVEISLIIIADTTFTQNEIINIIYYYKY